MRVHLDMMKTKEFCAHVWMIFKKIYIMNLPESLQTFEKLKPLAMFLLLSPIMTDDISELAAKRNEQLHLDSGALEMEIIAMQIDIHLKATYWDGEFFDFY